MTEYPEGSWVETPYPLTEEQARGPRESWPWLPGWVSEVCGPNEWLITVQVPELAELEDGTPAPEGTPEEEAFYPGCFRDSSEIRRAGTGTGGRVMALVQVRISGAAEDVGRLAEFLAAIPGISASLIDIKARPSGIAQGYMTVNLGR